MLSRYTKLDRAYQGCQSGESYDSLVMLSALLFGFHKAADILFSALAVPLKKKGFWATLAQHHVSSLLLLSDHTHRVISLCTRTRQKCHLLFITWPVYWLQEFVSLFQHHLHLLDILLDKKKLSNFFCHSLLYRQGTIHLALRRQLIMMGWEEWQIPANVFWHIFIHFLKLAFDISILVLDEIWVTDSVPTTLDFKRFS
jgi:hypothetical protein